MRSMNKPKKAKKATRTGWQTSAAELTIERLQTTVRRLEAEIGRLEAAGDPDALLVDPETMPLLDPRELADWVAQEFAYGAPLDLDDFLDRLNQNLRKLGYRRYIAAC